MTAARLLLPLSLALLAYETALFARSSAAAAESERILRLCFGDDGPVQNVVQSLRHTNGLH